MLAVLLSLIFTIIPLPVALVDFRPAWVLLLVLYVQFFLPQYFRVTWVFLLGLCLDVLLSSVMGEHALALLIVTFAATRKVRRFYFFSMLQQMFIILIFCIMYQLVIYLIDAFLGYEVGIRSIICTALISMFFWPWIRLRTISI